MATNIRRGFLDKDYVLKKGGSACIVQQPNGNYILITHDIDPGMKNPTPYILSMEYVGDFVCDNFGFYPTTKDLVTDPNTQVKNIKPKQKIYGY